MASSCADRHYVVLVALTQRTTGRKLSSREFNQDTAGAKRAAEKGPVYITDRGRPAHVLLTFEAYEQLIGAHHVLDTLSEPAGVEDIEFELLSSEETSRPAVFD